MPAHYPARSAFRETVSLRVAAPHLGQESLDYRLWWGKGQTGFGRRLEGCGSVGETAAEDKEQTVSENPRTDAAAADPVWR